MVVANHPTGGAEFRFTLPADSAISQP